MYNNIGKKIKTLSKILCWVGIIVSIIIAIVLFIIASDMIYGGETLIGIGLAFLFLGTLSSWINSFLIYGFGELVDNSSVIRKRLVNEPEGDKPNTEKGTFSNKTSSTPNTNNSSKSQTPKIISTPIGDNYKRCLICSRVLPIEQKTCPCGSVTFDKYTKE